MTISAPDDDDIDFSLPLRTAAELRERVFLIVKRAMTRQLWVFLLDEDGRQLAHVHSFDGIPASPETEILTNIVTAFSEALEVAAPGGSLVFTLERPGLATPHAFDELWADGLREAADGIVPIAVFLAHSKGVSELRARSATRR
jgi:hypothetical protein